MNLHPAIVAVAISVATVAVISPAQAEFKVRAPYADYMELELEHNGAVTFARKKPDEPRAPRTGQSYSNEIGFGVLPFWKLEFETEQEAEPGAHLSYSATTFENTFQLTPQGKFPVDVGFFFEYSHPETAATADSFEFGPLLRMELGHTLHTVNLLAERGVGKFSTNGTGFSYAWQSRYVVHPLFQPGFEAYGEIENASHAGPLSSQEHRIGPVLVSELNSSDVFEKNYGKLKFEAGYLFGLTNATDVGAVRWRLEYEIGF